VTIGDLIAVSTPGRAVIERAAEAACRCARRSSGVGYRDLHAGREHVALVLGDVSAPGVLVRVHSSA